MNPHLSGKDREYLQRRGRLLRAWPWVGGLLLLALAGLSAWLWWRIPNLIDPWLVMQQLNAGSLEPGTVQRMAAMLPIVVLTCLGLVALLILFGFQAMYNELRMLRWLKLCLGGKA